MVFGNRSRCARLKLLGHFLAFLPTLTTANIKLSVRQSGCMHVESPSIMKRVKRLLETISVKWESQPRASDYLERKRRLCKDGGTLAEQPRTQRP